MGYPYTTEAEFDNQLVRQKSRIIWYIDNDYLACARAALDVVKEMWESAGYEYKTRELELRLSQRILANSAMAS